MTTSKERALKDLLQEFRVTGDETLILELFATQEESITPTFEPSPTPKEIITSDMNTEDTMVFSEIYDPVMTGPFSLTSQTFDGDEQYQVHDLNFLTDSEYIQTGILGSGGMGTVLQVQDPQLKRKVAMKVLHVQTAPHHESTFLAEAQISALLQHPSIIPIYEFGTIKGTPYFTMQEIRGTSLKQLLHQEHTPELRETISILHTVSEAIAYSHSQGIVHRDLKPSNILVGEFGEVYVVDWGIAVILPHSAHRHLSMHPSLYLDPTATSIVGTVGYMSPEQASGQNATLSEVTDVFSIGSMLYEVLTEELLCTKEESHPLQWKQKLFDDIESQALFRTRLRQSLTTNTGLEDLCLQTLDPDPSLRLQEVMLLAKSLQQWLNGEMKQQQALEYLGNANSLQSEQNQLRQHISILIESYPETDSTTGYLHYQEIVGQRLRMKEYLRLQEQELHKGILNAPEIIALHTSVVVLDFQRYERALQHGKHDIVDDIQLKMKTHLSVLSNKERQTWEARLERCRKSYLVHPFNTPFVGHERLCDSISEMLRTQKVVTLFGSPGIGKSRIAIEACRAHFIRRGILFHIISCREIEHVDDIYGQIALALQVEINPPSLENLKPILTRIQQTCFIFDGVESHQEELPALIQQIQACSTECCFLMTTRSSKRISYGFFVEVPPLSTIESMDLFYWQAKRSRSSFMISKDNFKILEAIIRHLQYTPLSLEMVANKLSAYTLFELHEMLTTSEGYTLGSQTSSPIEKTLEWSWQLLSKRSQEMLTLCSYFSNNFTLSAIQAVLCEIEHIESYDTPEILQDLIESGLLLKTQITGQDRYSIPYVLLHFTARHQSNFEHRHSIDWARLSKCFVEYCKELDDTSQIKSDLSTLYSISRLGIDQTHIDSSILCAKIWIQYGPWKEACQAFSRLKAQFEESEYSENISLWYSRLLRLSGDTNQALNIIHQITEPTFSADKSLELALLYQLRADYPASNKWAEHTIALTNQNMQIQNCLHAHLILGINQNQQTNYLTSQNILLGIESQIKDLGELSLTIRLYSELCASYLECAKHDDAQNAIEQGLWYTKQGHYPKEQSELYFQLAKIKAIQGFYREGLPIAQQALQISQSIGDVYNEARILLTIGVCHNKMQAYETAKTVYEDALDCYRSVGNLRGEVLITVNLVQIYPKLGLHSDMNRLFESAEYLGSQLNDKRILGLIHSNRANYYASIGKFEESLESYELSNIFHIEINHEKGQTIALSNQAFILWQMGDIETAIATFKEAMNQSEQLQLQNNNVVLYGNFATLLLENNRLDEAYTMIQKCLSLSDEIQFRIGTTYFSSVLAIILSKQGNHEQAIQTFDKYAYESLRDAEQYILYECRKVECLYAAGRLGDTIETFKGINVDHIDLSQPTMWKVREELLRIQQTIGL